MVTMRHCLQFHRKEDRINKPTVNKAQELKPERREPCSLQSKIRPGLALREQMGKCDDGGVSNGGGRRSTL